MITISRLEYYNIYNNNIRLTIGFKQDFRFTKKQRIFGFSNESLT